MQFAQIADHVPWERNICNCQRRHSGPRGRRVAHFGHGDFGRMLQAIAMHCLQANATDFQGIRASPPIRGAPRASIERVKVVRRNAVLHVGDFCQICLPHATKKHNMLRQVRPVMSSHLQASGAMQCVNLTKCNIATTRRTQSNAKLKEGGRSNNRGLIAAVAAAPSVVAHRWPGG